jgi:Ca-activated chloride channel homolog
MLQFEYPWLFLLLLVQPLVWWLSPPYREGRESVAIPYLQRLAALTRQTPSRGAVVLRRPRALVFLLPFLWLLIVTALARPVWVAAPIEKIESTRDLMLLVDLSGSMETRDFTDPQGRQLSRLDAVKMVLGDFIGRRKNDRLGLIVFGDEPYLQVPFTRDHRVLETLLGQTETKMAGMQTAIGDAIGLAIRHFESSTCEQRVAVLLTDGNDTGSKVPPQKAAEIAAGKGITIHTIAVGDPQAAGEEKMDIEALQDIAAATKGSFFRADDRGQLETIYSRLDEIEPEKVKTLSYRPRYPLFQWPAGVGLVVFLGYHLLMAGFGRGRRWLGERPGREDPGARIASSPNPVQ